MHAVGGAPDVVVKCPFGSRRVVQAAADQPEAIFEDRLPAYESTGLPAGFLRFDFFPLDAVCRGPDIAVKQRLGRGDLRNRLASQHPDTIVECGGVPEGSRLPGNRPVFVDVRPRLAVGRVPDVEVIMSLIDVAADDPHFVAMDDIPGVMSAFPVGR